METITQEVCRVRIRESPGWGRGPSVLAQRNSSTQEPEGTGCSKTERQQVSQESGVTEEGQKSFKGRGEINRTNHCSGPSQVRTIKHALNFRSRGWLLG